MNKAATKKRDDTLRQQSPKPVSILSEEGFLREDDDESNKQLRLSPEIGSMVDYHLKDCESLISYEEAKKHREELMKERTVLMADAQSGWQQHPYNFCEQ